MSSGETTATLSPTTSASRAATVLHYAEIPMLILVPVVLFAAVIFEIDQAALLTMLVALVAVGVFIAGFETSHPALRQIMPTVVLAAVAVAGRILFFAVPSFQPVSAICILSGIVFGRRCGFMTGALAALVSNFFFGQGAWTPWQMYGWGMIGYFAGVLADSGLFGMQQGHKSTSWHRIALYVFAFVASVLYGMLLDTWTFVGYIRPLTWETALLTYGVGLPHNIAHGIASVIFLLIIYQPWCKKLNRIKTKYYALK